MENKDMTAKEALNYASTPKLRLMSFTWSGHSIPATRQPKRAAGSGRLGGTAPRPTNNIYESRFSEKFQRNPNVTVEPALKVKADEFKDVYNVLRIASTAYLTELTSAEFYSDMAKKFADDESLVKPSVTLRTWKKAICSSC